MGYGIRDGGIRTYWPDDTDTDLYLAGTTSLADILEKCAAKWPNVSMEDLQIEAEHIHTDCLYYDLYDSGDWTHFIHITKTS